MGKRLNLAERETLTIALKRLTNLANGRYNGTRQEYLTTDEQNVTMFAALDLLSVALTDHKVAVPSITRFIRRIAPPPNRWRAFGCRYAPEYIDWRTPK
jgi:hypothetical protein